MARVKRGEKSRAPLTAEQRDRAGDPSAVRMARSVAGRMAAGRVPWLTDELVSAALVALCEAARDYDPARGVPFAVYAEHRVRGAVLDELRASAPKGYRRDADRVLVFSLHAIVGDDGADGDDGDNRDSFVASVPSGELPVGWEIESHEEVLALTRYMPLRTAAAVRTFFLRCGATKRRIAAEAGTVESNVGHWFAAAGVRVRRPDSPAGEVRS